MCEVRCGTLLVSLLGLLIASPAAGAGEQPTAQVVGEMGVRELPAQTILVLPVRGSYEQHGSVIPQLMTYAGIQQIIRGAPFAIYYDNPETVPTDSLRWEVCVPVPAGTGATSPFEVREMPAIAAAVADCQGPYEEASSCYGSLIGWVAAQGLTISGPPQEHWLSDAQTTPPESLIARIIFPVARP